MSMFSLGRPILLMCMRARHMMSYANLLKKDSIFDILPPPPQGQSAL
jgi:hypothetical protein